MKDQTRPKRGDPYGAALIGLPAIGSVLAWSSVFRDSYVDPFIVLPLFVIGWIVLVIAAILYGAHVHYWIDHMWWVLVGLLAWLSWVLGSFAQIYLDLARTVPGSFTDQAKFSDLDAAYVSITTFTSLGSGSIQPTGEAARAVVTLESFVALITVAIAIGLMVAGIAGRKESH